MPVLHEAALICKLAWPSWSVCNYLPTCLLVLLTCAVPRCMMLTLCRLTNALLWPLAASPT